MLLCIQTSMPEGREGVLLTCLLLDYSPRVCAAPGLCSIQERRRWAALPSRSSRLVGQAPRSTEGVLTLREGAPQLHWGRPEHPGAAAAGLRVE